MPPEPAAAEAASGAPRTWSIAARLALMFAVAAAVMFALTGTILFRVLDRELDHYQREQMQGRLSDLRYMLEHGRSAELAEHAKAKMADMERNDGHTRFWLWSDDPRYRYGEDAEQIARRAVSAGLVRGQHGGFTLLGTAIAANDLRPALQLVIGVQAGGIANTLRNFRNALLGLSVLAALLVAALGYWIAVVGLRPVKQLSQEAERIGRNRSRDGERLRLPALPAELLNLAASFNAALDRLNAAYQQLETFNADVAHELRTPVANMIGQTQVMLARERSVPELRDVLQSNLEELERLRGIVADMLFLARAEQGERAQNPVQVSLAQEMGKIVDFFEMVLDDAGMQVQLQGDAQVLAQTCLLRRALSNLLQNAIQHARGAGAIAVQMEEGGEGMAQLSISNPCAPVQADALLHLFDRFYRVDGARANSDESHGLGLAIVKAVALMHGGTVAAHWGEGRMHIVLRLPVQR